MHNGNIMHHYYNCCNFDCNNNNKLKQAVIISTILVIIVSLLLLLAILDDYTGDHVVFFFLQGSAKLEKAEILQMTVDHLKMLQASGGKGKEIIGCYFPPYFVVKSERAAPLTRLKEWKSMLMAGLNSWESAAGTKEALDPRIVFAFMSPWEGTVPHSPVGLLRACLGFPEGVKTGVRGRQNKHK